MNKGAAIAAAVSIAAGTLVMSPGVGSAGSGKITVCVHKKTGQMLTLLGKKASKKCKKGFKKMTFAVTGPQGDAGPQGTSGTQGPQPKVVADDGAVLGDYVGTYMLPTLTILMVYRDGGVFAYYASGALANTGSPRYTDAACAGTPYVTAQPGRDTNTALGLVGGPSRMTFRRTDPSFGPAAAWKFDTKAYQSVAGVPTYQRDSTLACMPDDPSYTGNLIPLTPVAAPPDAPGPLKIA